MVYYGINGSKCLILSNWLLRVRESVINSDISYNLTLRKLLVQQRKHQGAPTFALSFKANAVSKQNIDITSANYRKLQFYLLAKREKKYRAMSKL